MKWIYEVDFLQASRLVSHAKVNENAPLPILKKSMYDYQGLKICERPPVRIYGSPRGCTIVAPHHYMLNDVPKNRKVHVMRIFKVWWSCSDLGWLVQSLAMQELIASGAVFRVNAFPKGLTDRVIDVIVDDMGGEAHVTKWTHMLNIVYLKEDGPFFHFGIVTRAEYNLLHDQNTKHSLGALSLLPPEDPASRAYFKMEEIFESHLKGQWCLPKPENCAALDIGSAPGGWSQVLSRHCRHVLAIDPGEMAVSRPNVIHLRSAVESSESAEAMKRTGKFSVCVCDINTWPRYAAELIQKHVLRFLNPGCILVLTFKLPKRCCTGHIQKLTKSVEEVLMNFVDQIKLLWLHSNTIHERTLLTKLK